MKVVCFECHERRAGCHSTCQKYKEWKGKLDKYKKQEKKALYTTAQEYALRKMLGQP